MATENAVNSYPVCANPAAVHVDYFVIDVEPSRLSLISDYQDRFCSLDHTRPSALSLLSAMNQVLRRSLTSRCRMFEANREIRKLAGRPAQFRRESSQFSPCTCKFAGGHPGQDARITAKTRRG